MVGTAAGKMLCYDSASGALVAELEAHAGPVQAVRFDHSGQCLVTAGADGSVRVWCRRRP